MNRRTVYVIYLTYTLVIYCSIQLWKDTWIYEGIRIILHVNVDTCSQMFATRCPDESEEVSSAVPSQHWPASDVSLHW